MQAQVHNKISGRPIIMARMSTKENKSIYQKTREDLGYSREKAADILETIPPERIERIESGKFTAHPDEIVTMAQKYKKPYLCNYYCANECEIGRQYVPEIQMKDLSQIILEMIASLNSVQKKQERLIEITADGVVEKNEVGDFIEIQDELEKISITIETLQLWLENKIASGQIDMDAYKEAMAARKDK
jgi:Helix-turn-helix.